MQTYIQYTNHIQTYKVTIKCRWLLGKGGSDDILIQQLAARSHLKIKGMAGIKDVKTKEDKETT